MRSGSGIIRTEGVSPKILNINCGHSSNHESTHIRLRARTRIPYPLEPDLGINHATVISSFHLAPHSVNIGYPKGRPSDAYSWRDRQPLLVLTDIGIPPGLDFRNRKASNQ